MFLASIVCVLFVACANPNSDPTVTRDEPARDQPTKERLSSIILEEGGKKYLYEIYYGNYDLIVGIYKQDVDHNTLTNFVIRYGSDHKLSYIAEYEGVMTNNCLNRYDFTYDNSSGKLVQISRISSSSYHIEVIWDGSRVDRLVKADSSGDVSRATYEYDSSGNHTAIFFYSDMNTTYAYDKVYYKYDRLKNVAERTANNGKSVRTYYYDDNLTGNYDDFRIWMDYMMM